MTARKNKQPGETTPMTHEQWLKEYEALIGKAQALLDHNDIVDAEDEAELRVLIKKMKRALEILNAPLATPGEQG